MKDHDCDHCNASYVTRQQLHHHMYYSHGTAKPKSKNVVGCVVCGATFKDQPSLMVHIVTHANDGLASKKRLMEIVDEITEKTLAEIERDMVYVINEEP